MFGLKPGMHLFLLQDKFFKDDNPMDAMAILIGLGIIIVVAIVVHFLRKGTSSHVVVSSKTRTTVSPKKFNPFAIRRIASEYSLDRDQAKLLEFIFQNDAVSDPERVMKNPALLDRHFKRTFRSIEKNSNTDEDAQQSLLKLFTLRNIIESSSGANAANSPKLSENTPAILLCGKDNFPVKVLLSRGQNVVTEIPRNALGTPVRFSKGTGVSLSFFTKSSDGFSLEGQVTGTISTDRGSGLQIKHTGKMKPLVKRQYRRKQTEIRCEFFFVNVVESGTGKKSTSKLVVDSKRLVGSIQDISVGGCALKTSGTIAVGSRLKITVEYDDNYTINVLGQVIRVNRSGTGTIIHIKFIKVPRRAFNSISTLVFSYNE